MKRIIFNNSSRYPGEFLPFDIDANGMISIDSVFRLLRTDFLTRSSKVTKSGLKSVRYDNVEAVNKLLNDALKQVTEKCKQDFLAIRESLRDKIVISPSIKIDVSKLIYPIKRCQIKTNNSLNHCPTTYDKLFVELKSVLEYMGSDRIVDDFRHSPGTVICDLIVHVNEGEFFTIRKSGVGMVSTKPSVKGGMVRFDFGTSAISIEDLPTLRRYASYCVDEPPTNQLPLESECMFCAFLEVYKSNTDFRIGSDKAILKLRSTSSLVSAFDIYKTFYPTSGKVVFKNKLKKFGSVETFVDTRAGKFPIDGLKSNEIGRFLDVVGVKDKLIELCDGNVSDMVIGWRMRRKPKIKFGHSLANAFRVALGLDIVEDEESECDGEIRENDIIENNVENNVEVENVENTTQVGVIDLPLPLLPTNINTNRIVDDEEIILNGKFKLGNNCEIKYQTTGIRWCSVADIMVASGHCSRRNISHEINNIFNGSKVDYHYRSAKFRDSRNILHKTTVIPFDQINLFVTKSLRGPNADALRTQMAELHSKWQAGDSSVIETTLINREIANVAPVDSYAGVNATLVNENNTNQIENSTLNPIQTAIASGVPVENLVTIQRTPPSERICFSVRGKMDKDEFDDLSMNNTRPGIYVIIFKPKNDTPPQNCPSPPTGCMTLISSKQDCVYGGAKIGSFGDDGLNRIRDVCDSYFQQNLFDIHIKSAFTFHSATFLEKSIKKHLSKKGLLPQDPKTRSNYILNEYCVLNKVTEALLFTIDFGEEELMELVLNKKKKIDNFASSPVKLRREELLQIEMKKIENEKEIELKRIENQKEIEKEIKLKRIENEYKLDQEIISSLSNEEKIEYLKSRR